MNKQYRLVWFQHLRKAAGSSLVQLAIANGEVLYPQHRNGNPLTTDGRLIRLWEMDAAELLDFVDHCETEGITFVSTEWGAPDFTILASDARVILITCLRDPLRRYLSEFYYAVYRGRTERRSPEDFVNSKGTHSIFTQSMFNYYCRIFSRYNDSPEPIGQEQFELATSALSLLTYRAILEDKDSCTALYNMLGWTKSEAHANRTELSLFTLSRLLIEGRIHQLWRHLTIPRKVPDEAFVRLFKEQNQWDR